MIIKTCVKNVIYAITMVKPSVAIPKPSDFNSIITLDLMEYRKKNVLWMVLHVQV